ncbi:MAG: hypothetical protein RL398_2867, partial [Planctomycetota bacterium]
MTRILAVPSLDKALAPRGGFDAVVVVGHDLSAIRHAALQPAIKAQAAVDAAFAGAVSMAACGDLAGGRLITAPTGPIGRDHDDVRRYAEAAQKGIRRARDAGSKKPLLVLQAPPAGDALAAFARTAALGGAGGLWEPLEAREALGGKVMPVEAIGVAVLDGSFGKDDAAWVEATDGGINLARDLCGTEPERMAP